MRATTKAGDLVTNATAEELADEAEAGYELQPGRGRPSLTGRKANSPQVTFRLTGNLRQQAQTRAEQEGKTVSALAREALKQYLAS